jgi:ABC-2 type transport system permease protein
MNMFLHELKAYRKTTIVWACSMSALVIFLMSLYTAISADAANFQKLLEGFPKELTQAFGFTGDIFSIAGYYSFTLLYVLLCGSIQAMNMGTSIISKEFRQKTADFLMTKPVNRSKIMTSKILAVLTSLVISDAVYFAAALAITSIVSSEAFSMKIFVMISLTLLFIQLIFMALGVVFSVVMPKIKSVLSVSLSVVFGFFILDMFGSVIGEKAIRYVTPFKYYDRSYIMKNGSYEVQYIILEIVLIAIAIAASYLLYSRKDIHAV